MTIPDVDQSLLWEFLKYTLGVDTDDEAMICFIQWNEAENEFADASHTGCVACGGGLSNPHDDMSPCLLCARTCCDQCRNEDSICFGCESTAN